MPSATENKSTEQTQSSKNNRSKLLNFVSAKSTGEAMLYLLFSVLCIAIPLTVVDRFVIPALEDSGALESGRWQEQDGWLLEQGRRKNEATFDCSVWRSAGFPVSQTKLKPKRIIVMGDSFAWGTGYPNMNTLWWRRLQNVLDERGYKDVEVIGAGMPAQSTASQLEEARKIVGTYKPDMIIWGYVTNDPDEISATGKKIVPLMRDWKQPKDDFPLPVKRSIEAVFPNLAWHLFDIRRSARLKTVDGAKYGYDYGTWELKLLEGENFRQYQNTVKNVAEFIKELNVPSFAVTLPAGFQAGDTQRGSLRSGATLLTKMHDYHVPRYEKVKKLFDSNGLPYYDTLDEITNRLQQNLSPQELNSLQLGINPSNGHPAASLCHLYAVCTADILEKNYSGFLGSKTQGKPTSALPKFNDWTPHSAHLNRLSESRYIFYMPQNEKDALYLPLRKPYVQLNFEKPADLASLTLSGGNLKKAEIYVVDEDPVLGYDRTVPRKLAERKGNQLTVNLPADKSSSKISSILISAEIKGEDNRVLLDVVPRQ